MCHVTSQSCCLSESSSERLPLFRRCSSMCTNMIKRTKAETEDRGEEAALLSSKHQRPCGHPGFSRPHHSRGEFSNQSVADCRALCARYRAVKLEIAEGKKASSRLDSESFDHVFGNVEHLYSEVSCPRGQIADAQALFDLTASLLASVKDIRSGQTASEIVTAIIKNFGRNAAAADEKIEPMIDWEKLGHEACAIFSDVPGMITMLGPMESQPKPRKTSQRRPRDRIVEGARPEELQDTTNNTTETDKNMETMFNVLRRSKVVYLEDILLNRNSFSQTVENIFALSFLVKDGRAKIFVDKGRHLVGPMNFPSQQQRERGEGLMHQFVFRFDFKDWQVMKEVVEERTELRPHRERVVPNGTRGSSTRVREVSRNRARGTDQLEDAEGKAENEDELPKRKRKTMVGSLL